MLDPGKSVVQVDRLPELGHHFDHGALIAGGCAAFWIHGGIAADVATDLAEEL